MIHDMEDRLQQFTALSKRFGLDGEIVSIQKIDHGNINATYDVRITDQNGSCRLVFQRLNLYVFKKPEQIMENIQRITRHISKKLNASGRSREEVLQFLYTPDGKNYDYTGEEFWRISEYVPNTVAYQDGNDLRVLTSVGQAFGQFQKDLLDFDASLLHETIPKFHDTRNRIAVLMRHWEENGYGRSEEVKEEIQQIKEFQKLATFFNELLDTQRIPLRVTHNDTKINNVLFDIQTGKAKTVIDLDTVMPGLVAYDFGDAVRFVANTSAEDEADLSKVGLDMARFSAFARGFLSELAPFLTPIEIQTMALGALSMTVELAVRFLEDYIMGDPYFKISYATHNLVRARCQLCLAKSIYEHLDEMNRIVMQLSKEFCVPSSSQGEEDKK